MQMKRRHLPNFEMLSAAMFATLATLAITAAQPARAQAPQSQPPSTASSPNVSGANAAIPANKWTAEQIAEAFKRTDANGDGNVTKQEAAAWKGLAERFDQVDANKDGLLSSAEFNAALK